MPSCGMTKSPFCRIIVSRFPTCWSFSASCASAASSLCQCLYQPWVHKKPTEDSQLHQNVKGKITHWKQKHWKSMILQIFFRCATEFNRNNWFPHTRLVNPHPPKVKPKQLFFTLPQLHQLFTVASGSRKLPPPVEWMSFLEDSAELRKKLWQFHKHSIAWYIF